MYREDSRVFQLNMNISIFCNYYCVIIMRVIIVIIITEYAKKSIAEYTANKKRIFYT